MCLRFNEELEFYVLMGCMLSDSVAELVMISTGENHFFDTRNKALYKAIRRAWDTNKNCDMTLVVANLREDETLDSVGGSAYLEKSLTLGIHDGIVEQSLYQLQGQYLRREVVYKTAELSVKAREMDGYDAVDALATMISSINSSSTHHVAERGDLMLKRLRSAPLSPKLLLGIPRLDEGIYRDCGLYRGQVEITIADSSHGKTTYAMFKAIQLLKQGYRVAWFQLEDSPRKTLERIEIVDSGLLLNFYITSRNREIEDTKREIRVLKRKYEIDYVVIDYIQNVESKNQKLRHEVTEYVSKELTKLMEELQIVGHLLSQVTIDTRLRKGWQLEPRLNDVRQSQQIKQDAHLMTSVFRPFVIADLIDTGNDAALDWNGNRIDKRSVYIKQQKVRDGELQHRRLHMIHKDMGLVIAN